MRTNPLFDFSHLTAAKRIQLAQDLWDSLEPAEIDEAVPLTGEQTAALDRFLACVASAAEAARVAPEQYRTV